MNCPGILDYYGMQKLDIEFNLLLLLFNKIESLDLLILNFRDMLFFYNLALRTFKKL